jgi:hypothetical protein
LSVPSLIAYPAVLQEMQHHGFVSLYHNSGAFGFEKNISVYVVGWIGPADQSIRSEALMLAHQVPPPFEENLAKLVKTAWLNELAGRIWVMPKSHWAYELEFGNRDWLAPAMRELGVDAEALSQMNNAAAIEFSDAEAGRFEAFARQLLEKLRGSDFLVAFPGCRAICTLHHHKQVWWQTADEALAMKLGEIAAG